MQANHRSLPAGAVAVALVAVLGVLASGCELDGKEFRTVAGPSLEAGVTTAATGLIDAAFAIYMPDDEDNNSATTDSDTGA